MQDACRLGIVSGHRWWVPLAAAALAFGARGVTHAQEAEFVKVGDLWKYFKGTEAPPADWNTDGFDASGWLEGATGIGYADNDDATVLDDMQQAGGNPGYMAFFARIDFEVTDAAQDPLVFQMDYDDGFVAYLNGTEIARANIGTAGTPPLFDEVATAQHEAGTATSFILPPGSLLVGTNVLAVEVHNNSLTSSDASCIPSLTGKGSVAPTGLGCTLTAGTIVLAWTNVTDYDEIRVVKNGAEIASLPGATTTYTDAAPDALDNVYEILAISGTGELSSGTCRINCTQATVTATLALVGGVTTASVTWTNAPTNLTEIEVLREGASQTTLPPTATEYADPNVESDQPEDDTNYTIVFRRSDGRTCTVGTGDITLCPQNLSARAIGGDVELQWDNVVKAWDHYEISRNGTLIDSAVPGNATSWVDTDINLVIGESYDYAVHPVAVAGGDIAAACDLAVSLGYAPEVGTYSPPPGGWDYQLDFESLNTVLYNPVAGETGNLDGQWIRSTNRDLWDGSAPFDVGPAPDGPAPGGVDVVSRPAEGVCGVSTKVLRVLDPGNTAAAIGTTFPDPFDPPNNSRIVLGLDMGQASQNLLKSGVTFYARIRTSPDVPSYMNPNPSSGDGYAIATGMGHVGVYHRPLGGAGPNASAAFSLTSGNNGGDLQFSAGLDLDGVGVKNFLAIWLTVQEGAVVDTYDVNVYVNGSTTPSTEVSGTGLTLLDTANADFGTEVANYVAIAMNNTTDDAMVDIDALAYKVGVFPPSVTPCSGDVEICNNGTDDDGDTLVDCKDPDCAAVPACQTAQFRRGDADDSGVVNITDAIFALNYLFTGGDTPPCLDAADTDDDGAVNITDCIGILNFLFTGGVAPAPPGNESCGPDPKADTIPACLSTRC